MRLAAKLILLFLVGVLLIVMVFSYLTIQQNRQFALAEHERRAEEIAAAIRPMVVDAWKRGGDEGVERVFQRSVRRVQQVEMRWVRVRAAGDPGKAPLAPADVIVSERRVTTLAVPGPSGQETVVSYIPIETEDGVAGSIEVAAPNDDTQRRLARSLVTSGVALLSVTVLSCVVILVGGLWMVGRPLEQLIDKVHRVAKGDFTGPVRVGSRDELGRLGSALNDMCDQLAEQRSRINEEAAQRVAAVRQLRHADRLGTVGRLAAGVAHEMGTPLNVVSGRAELIAGGRLSEDDTRRSAEIIRTETERITKIVRELLDFARRGTPARSRVDLIPVLRQTIRLLEPVTGKQSIGIEIEAAPRQAIAEADAGQIQQVFTNLLMNAAQSMPDGGKVEVGVARVILAPPRASDESSRPLKVAARPFWRIDVRDQGVGIDPHDLEHLFEPFFTTKDVGEGTGLGLSIAYGIVQDHDGWIDVNSEPGRGSCFSVFLPTTGDDD
jgi:signal transduction histidine kinase